MAKIIVTGSKGQLGMELQKLLMDKEKFQAVFTDIEELDITSKQELETFITKHSPKILINCSAYTNVDKAESEKEKALLVNHKGPGFLAETCKKNDVFFIHVSTDYVFDGKAYKPYKENDPTDPVNFYGETKVLGEEEIQKIHSNSVIIRTSWLYSQHGSNFVKTMVRLGKERRKLGVIDDQVGTPTYAGDLANAIIGIVDRYLDNNDFEKGIYHFANEGVCSWFDFARKIHQHTKSDCEVNPIETKDYPTPAVRPFYSVLSKKRIKDNFQLEIPHWEDSLEKCLKALGEIK